MNYSTSSGGSLESQEGLDLALARTNRKQQAFSLRVTGGQNMNQNLKPVLIAGAGPTGMMAAIELSRLNIPVRLIEKKAEPETTSRAIGVQARTLELLEQRGLASSLVKLGNPGLAFSLYGDGKRIWRLGFERISSKYNYLLFVSQAETEKALREALDKAGIRIERNLTFLALGHADLDTKLTAVLQHTDGSLEQFECSYLIDAEGAHSTARGTVGLHFEGKSHVEGYALGDLHIVGDLVETDFHIFSSTHGFISLFPMGGRRFRLMADNPISKPSKETQPSLGELQQIYDQRSHIPAKFRDMSWSSWFRINSRMVNRLQVGRVFLGGDDRPCVRAAFCCPRRMVPRDASGSQQADADDARLWEVGQPRRTEEAAERGRATGRGGGGGKAADQREPAPDPARMYPCRRFGASLTGLAARLGAGV